MFLPKKKKKREREREKLVCGEAPENLKSSLIILLRRPDVKVGTMAIKSENLNAKE